MIEAMAVEVAEPSRAGAHPPVPPSANLPRISLVTPSFNQAKFLGETIESVLFQHYPNLEYVVIDGGSTDESTNILRAHESRLSSWVSEKDAGQYDALNKGFARTTGEVMAWLNSDDKYTPWALATVGDVFAQLPQVQWLTTLLPLHWDARGLPVRCKPVQGGFSRTGFLRGDYLPPVGSWGGTFIQQESTFWRRSLWEKAGGKVDASLQLAGDFELWARFFEHADLYGVELPLGGFRVHGEQKTALRMIDYVDEAMSVLHRHGGHPLNRRLRLRNYVPSRLRDALGMTDSYKVCVHRDGRWTTATRRA
jgi:glycosyltransferase involved in cell wall biosynthesis